MSHLQMLQVQLIVSLVTPSPGMPVSQIWMWKSSLAGDQAAAGNINTAMRLLSRQLGMKNFTPLKLKIKNPCFWTFTWAAIHTFLHLYLGFLE
jgi:hypothetical protein